MNYKKYILSILLFIFYEEVSFAQTNTVSSSMNISATINPSCTISVTPMNFGNIDLKNSSKAQAELTFNCTKDVIFYIKPDGGMNSNGSNNLFYMKNLANVSTNTKAATGLIMDVDYASESADMTSKQMLMQASSAMLKQSNSMASMVMSLLQ